MRNFHIISIKKQIPMNTVTIAIKMDIQLITIFSTYQIHQRITIRGEKKKVIIINQEIKIKTKIKEHL